jgi:hypothetical protein
MPAHMLVESLSFPKDRSFSISVKAQVCSRLAIPVESMPRRGGDAASQRRNNVEERMSTRGECAGDGVLADRSNHPFFICVGDRPWKLDSGAVRQPHENASASLFQGAMLPTPDSSRLWRMPIGPAPGRRSHCSSANCALQPRRWARLGGLIERRLYAEIRMRLAMDVALVPLRCVAHWNCAR